MNPHDDSSDDEGEEEFTPFFLIQQFLAENGYSKTLETFQVESGKKYRPKGEEFGSGLESMIHEYREKRLNKQLSELNLEGEKGEFLQERGDKVYATKLEKDFPAHHKSNILSVSFNRKEEEKMIATGSTDKSIKLTNYQTGETVYQFVGEFNAAVIALDFNPIIEKGSMLLAGSMDGSHAILDVEKKEVIQTFKDHKKYVVICKWHPSGSLFATGSHDHTVKLYKLNSNSNSFELLESFEFNQNVETIAFTSDGNKMFVGIRDTNYIQVFDLANGNEKTKINMNANGDDHVSFSAIDIAFHPKDDSFFLVATDRSRMILFQQGSSIPVRDFWGAENDMYANVRCAWSHSGDYVYSTSQDYKIHCWEVSNQKNVSKLDGHKSTVRDLVIHPTQDLLASCSFDKSLKLWSV